jgi:hypothetical protein
MNGDALLYEAARKAGPVRLSGFSGVAAPDSLARMEFVECVLMAYFGAKDDNLTAFSIG